MAGENNPRSAAVSPRTPGGRAAPVLVPQGALAGQPDVPLDRPVTTVGSNENARLHLVSRTVSKGHAIFVNSGGITYVADMASRTGVLVNGKLVKDAELKTGDRVQIGKFVFRYRAPANVAPAVSRPVSPAAAVIVVGSPAVPAQGRTVIIGRRETSDIAIPGDSGVSAAHAVIFQMDGQWYIRDLASRTGTKVNGSSIHQQELNFGDRILVGSTNILFQPGIAKPQPLEDSTAPDLPLDLSDELGSEEMPVDDLSGFDPDAAGEPEPVETLEPVPVEASEQDDAIPLGDWRSGIAAEPVESPVDAAAENEPPLELELELEEDPSKAQAEPFEVMDSLAGRAEPSDSVEADEDVFALADETPAAAEEAETVVPLAPAAAERMPDATAAEPVEAELEFATEPEPAAVADAPRQISEAVAVAETVQEAIRAPEPVAQPAVIETTEADLPIFEGVVAVPQTVPAPQPEAKAVSAAPAPPPLQAIAATATQPEKAAAPPPPAPVPPVVTAPAAAPAKPAPLPAVEHLLGDVEEFVFVPTQEPVDPNTIPDVIFWGDPELDTVTERVVTSSAPVVPPAAKDKQPPADTDGNSNDDGAPPSPPTDLPPGPASGPTGATAAPVNGQPERSASPVRTEYSAVGEIVPEHHAPAASLDLLQPLDVTEIAPVDLRLPSAANAQAVIHTVEIPDSRPSVAGGESADLNAVVNADWVEAAPVESLPNPSDVPIEVAKIEAAEPGHIDASNFDAEHLEADYSASEPEVPGELVEPLVDDRDEFFTPLSPALEEAFRAARAWNDAPANEDAAPFEVIAPFEPNAQGAWQIEPSALAVEVLEPQEAPQSSDHDVNFPVLNATSVAREPMPGASAVVNADLLEPVFSTAAAEDAAIAAAELDLPAVDALPPTDWSATINVDLDTPIALATSTANEPAAVSQPLDLPELEADGSTVDIATDVALDMATVEAAAAVSRGAVEFPELDLSTAVAAEPVAAIVNVDLDAPAEVSIAGVEENATTSSERLYLPQIEGTPAEASPRVASDLAADIVEFSSPASNGDGIDFSEVDAELSTESAEFQPAVSIDDELEFTDPAELPETFEEAPAADGPTADAAGGTGIELGDAAAAGIAAAAAVTSVSQTPPTTDFAAVVSADVDAVVDVPVEPVEETITLSEDQAVLRDAGVDEIASDETDESDLEFLDFGEPQSPPVAEAAPVVEPPAAPRPTTPVAETSQVAPEKSAAPTTPAPPRKGPSLFGFDFEGGSFLGGMPISLADKSAIPKPPTPVVPPAPPRNPAFDARATPPSGFGSMAASIVSRSGGPAVPPATPPRPVMRPAVPPPVARSVGPSASMSGLVSDSRSASGSPVIPPAVKSIAGNTTAAGVGLIGNITSAGMAPRSVEVFSQLSEPIGVEVFGGRPGNPGQFTIPDTDENAKLEPVESDAGAEEEVSELEPVQDFAAATSPVPNVRWWRVPLWLSLMILTPAAAWVGVPRVLHEVSSFSGSLSFAGLKDQQPVDLHNFVETQKALLVGSQSEEIRLGAKAILLKDGHPPGFTADPSQFAQAVQTQDFVFANDHIEFKLDWPDPVMARAQVDAVLLALAEKDQDLADAKQKALIAADNAKTRLDSINADLIKLTAEYHTQAERASEKPDELSVSQNQQDVMALADRYNSAHAARVSSESLLADWKAQDPTKPIDPESDKQIVDLKKRLDLLNEQIRLAKSKGGVNAASGSGIGTDVSVGATTQPDSAVDPLLKAMQEQADNWSGKIQRRRDELALQAAIPADQRAVNQAAAIENLSIKITNLQKSEDDLKIQLDAAKLKQAQFQKQISDSNLAEVHKNELYRQIQDKEAEKQAAAENAAKLETAYENSITVAGQSPARFLSVTNFRRTAMLVISILAGVVFGRLTLGELLRPRIVTSARPASAPLVNPPMRVVPWPQPHQLQGLKNNGAG